ncbi:MAG: hypothetical protein ACRDIV_03800 [Ktedonobacteraceae bacterium]
MRHLRFRGPSGHHFPSHGRTQKNTIVLVFCSLVIVVIALASCGSTAAGQTIHTTPTTVPTQAPTATVTATPVTPTVTPTPKPTSAPQPTPVATQPPQPTTPPPVSMPPILDLRPSSMSFVGHLDCPNKNGTYTCQAIVTDRASATSNLHWTGFTNVPGNIVFSPSGGTLAPGQSVLVSIIIPTNDCTQGLFFFRGPVNTHTITWAC